MNVKFLGLVLVPLLLSACAGRRHADTDIDLIPTDRYGLAQQPQVHIVHHSAKKGFLIESRGYRAATTLLTPLAILVQGADSNSVREKFALEDPVIHGKDLMKVALERELGLTNVRIVPDVSSDGTIDILKKRYTAGVVLELRTGHWGMDNRRVKYNASAKLTNLADSQVLWSTTCQWAILDQKGTAPEEEALFANDGALLKANLLKAAEICVNQITLRLLTGGRHMNL
jgi:hypothetical protein